MMKKKFLIGGIIILIAIASLGFVAFRGAATYYYPVSQALEKASTLSNKTIRIEGQVVPNSLVQVPSATNNGIKFVLADMTVSTDTIPISYQGALPDAFKEGNDAVVEGQLTPDGNFQATQIIVKCPSKYVPVTATPTTTIN